MKKYKDILASDFDGTLFINSRIDPVDIRAIKDFQENGGLFGLVTGRSLVYLLEDLKDYIRPDFYILTNGAHILIRQDNDLKELYKSDINKDLVRELVDFYKNDKRLGPLKIFTRDRTYDVSRLDYIREDILSLGLYTNYNIDKFREDLLSYHPSTGVFDITNKDINKQMGIDIIKKHYLFNKEIYAIGDDLNDLEFLEATSLSYTLAHVKDKRVRQAARFKVRSIAHLIALIRRVK